MCGLNIVLGNDELAYDRIQKMNEAIEHRGTTNEMTILPHFTLGHVRLPIQGLHERFDQPYHAHGWTFLFVGEITNWKHHHDYENTMESDIEVLAKAWGRQGPSCVWSFDGFWSIVAIPDAAPWEVHVVVDYLAQKPLYVYSHDGEFAISSEIRGLDAIFPLSPNYRFFSAVEKFGYDPSGEVWADHVRKMKPGEHLVVDLSAKAFRRFSISRLDHVAAVPMWDTELKQCIVESITDRVMTSDVPMSILLSGGLDSAIVYQIARKVRKDITIYHVANDEDEFLDMLEPEHPVVRIEYPPNVDLDDVLRTNEGPVDLGSMIPQYLMARKIEDIVCLSGDGADELFGGYRRSLEYDSQGSDVWQELVHYHLPRLDKMMMRERIELRCPFLGRDVLCGALGLPYDKRQDKIWLREAFEKEVPERIRKAAKRPLKSAFVKNDAVGWRRRLCVDFLKLLDERKENR